jgi:hypothetical protein
MATFIPNVGDVTPEVEYFKPNLELMTGYLETKQGQFNQAREELSSLYTTLKSMDLTLDENKQRREEFFKTADQQLKKISGVDLSLEQNVSAAKRIFAPLVEDEALVEDIMFTGKIKNVASTAEKFKNSSKEEDRKRYNPISVQYAALKQEEYAAASPEARKRIAASNISYASNANLMEKATALAKEMDLNVSLDTVTGGYVVTNKNGQLAVPHLQEAFTKAFSSDPEVSEFYKQKSYVDVQSQILSAAEKIGYDNAVSAVGNVLQKQAELLSAKTLEEVKSAKEALLAEKEILENKIQTEGVVEGSEAHRDYLQVLQNLQESQNAEEAVVEKAQRSLQQVQSLDDLYSLSYEIGLTTDIQSAAEALSMRNSGMSLKVDQFELEKFKQANRLEAILYKAQVEGLTSSDGKASMFNDPLMAALNIGAKNRGADMTEQAESSDLDQTDKALASYIDLTDQAYMTFIADFLSPQNGGSLPLVKGKGKEAYIRYSEALARMSPEERAMQISKDIALIKKTGKYNEKLYEDFQSLEEGINNAKADLSIKIRESRNTFYKNVDPVEGKILELAFNGLDVLNEDEFVKKASDYIIEANADKKDLYTDYINFYRDQSGGMAGFSNQGGSIIKTANTEKLRKLYQDQKENINSIFKYENFNVHSYFDPDVQNTKGSGYALEVKQTYMLDPMRYHDQKRMRSGNAFNGYTMLTGVLSGAYNSEASYIYEGSMQENDVLNAADFEDKEEALINGEKLPLQLIDAFVKDSNAYDKSSSTSRPTATLDAAKGILVDNKKYVAVQLTFDEEWIENKKDITGFENAKTKYTMFVPQTSIPVGYFASDGSGALLSSIRRNGSVTTDFPNDMGNVTYTYDEETGKTEIYGKIKHLNPENGGYEFKQYVESTDEDNFDIVRTNMWSLYQSVKDENKELLKQFEQSQGITRITDPKKLQ